MLYDKRWDKVETKEEWRSILLEAANIIERYGWHQGDFGSKGLGFCALGAIKEASKDGTGMSTAMFRASRYVGGYIDSWNDHVWRTKEEVVAALRGAAAGHNSNLRND